MDTIVARRIVLLAVTLSFAAPLWGAATVAIQGVRVHQAPDYTRVVFDTSAPVRYRLFTLEDPPRVVLDLDDAAPRNGLELGGISIASTSVVSLRSAVRGGKLNRRRDRQCLGLLGLQSLHGHEAAVEVERQGLPDSQRP